MLNLESKELKSIQSNLKTMLSNQGFTVDSNGAVTNYASKLLELERAVESAKKAQDAYDGDDKNRQKTLRFTFLFPCISQTFCRKLFLLVGHISGNNRTSNANKALWEPICFPVISLSHYMKQVRRFCYELVHLCYPSGITTIDSGKTIISHGIHTNLLLFNA